MSKSSGGRDPSSGKFLPGSSPNPAGRPRKDGSVGAAITGAFAKKVQVTQNGKPRRITKLEAAATQIANSSASGDLRAVKMGMELARKAEEAQTRAPAQPERLSESDQEIADRLLTRLHIFIKENGGE